MHQNVLYYGSEAALPEQLQLRAGPLSLIYEAGDLRYIRLGEREILRRVYVAVRDRNWGTIAPELSNVQVDAAHDHFTIRYDVTNRQGEINFFWHATISGDAQGTITFRMDGSARSSFLRNRIGFCVLHPAGASGVACMVEHADGTTEHGSFPQSISPDQPFKEMLAISHEVEPGVWAEVRFSGDIFEMEDQRNWIDASYKTYCTPLRIPYPVEIQAGERVLQSATISLQGDGRIEYIVPETAQSPVVCMLDSAGRSMALPRIGLGTASHGQPLTQREIKRLKALNLAHLRVDLQLDDPAYQSLLERVAHEAMAIGVQLELALHLSDNAAQELATLAGVLARVQPPVASWLIFHQNERSTQAQWVALARTDLEHYQPAALFGGGTNAYFTQLNRERPVAEELDLVCYSINPQVHAFDNASLTETLAAIPSTVESARRFCAGRPLAITPVTLRPRFNPDATGPIPEPAPGTLPPEVDLRQMSLYGAGWTLGSLKYLAESGVASTTYYETSGWRGVMEQENGSPLPHVFRSLPGTVFPLYHVLADIGAYAGGEVLLSRSSDPLRVECLALKQGDQQRVLVANLSNRPQQVLLQDLPAQVQVRMLDQTNVFQAMREPEAFRTEAGIPHQTEAGILELVLLPYAIACVDAL